jgi:hypothetical protein
VTSISQAAPVHKSVYGIIAARLALGVLNLFVACGIYLANTPQAALQLNGVIGSLGPFVQMAVGAMGLAGMASKRVQPRKIMLLVAGVTCLVLGTR